MKRAGRKVRSRGSPHHKRGGEGGKPKGDGTFDHLPLAQKTIGQRKRDVARRRGHRAGVR